MYKVILRKLLRSKFVNVYYSLLMFCIAQSVYATPIMNKWFALGSGCRAKNDLIGNVTGQISIPNNSMPNLYRAQFFFTNFELKGDEFDANILQFAKECAIRLNINPPSNQKIIALKATTSISFYKDPGVTLDLFSELKLGSTSLEMNRKTLLEHSNFEKENMQLSLSSNSEHSNPMPALRCGEAKIIGFDYSWLAKRAQKKITPLLVKLGGDSSLTIEAILEPCQ